MKRGVRVAGDLRELLPVVPRFDWRFTAARRLRSTEQGEADVYATILRRTGLSRGRALPHRSGLLLQGAREPCRS